ncbi:TraR/DksA family transcriptional regulator [Streptosporangium canum]|uniref:TraR/DksA family transcriptional regulator n=1 Tax=Streptosporangium canum TaxID=324952 RepID=UPI000B88FA2D
MSVISWRTSTASWSEGPPRGTDVLTGSGDGRAYGCACGTGPGRLDELDQTFERLRQEAYGVCESCGRPVAVERLRARPAARTCIECAAGTR